MYTYKYNNFNSKKSQLLYIEERISKQRKNTKPPCIMCVQYIGDVQYIRGCSVHRGDIMSISGGYHEYIGGCSVHRRIS